MLESLLKALRSFSKGLTLPVIYPLNNNEETMLSRCQVHQINYAFIHSQGVAV